MVGGGWGIWNYPFKLGVRKFTPRINLKISRPDKEMLKPGKEEEARVFEIIFPNRAFKSSLLELFWKVNARKKHFESQGLGVRVFLVILPNWSF